MREETNNIKLHTVEFLDGEALLKTEKVLDGMAASAPTDIVKEGYDFIGWDQEFTNVKSNLTVNAIYEPKTYTVKFLVNGSVVSNQSVNHNQSATPPASPFKEGYNFIGWDQEFVNVKSNLDINAKFEIKTFTVKFFNGDLLLDEQVINYNESAIAPSNPTKEGYDFTGWDQTFVNVKSNINVNANFKIKTYVVNFFHGNKLIDKQIIAYNQAAIAPSNPYQQGYDFDGWDQEFTNVKSDLNIKAKFKVKTFTVKFYYGDNQVDEKIVSYNKTAIPPTNLEKEGYDFINWDQEFANVKSNLEINANYQIKKFSVKFLVNGVVVDDQIVEYNQSAVSPPDPEVDGKIFEGWDTDFTHVKSNLLVRAVISDIPIYTIQFIDSITNLVLKRAYLRLGESADAPKVDDTKVGYQFNSWSGEASNVQSDLDIYALYDEIIETFDITLGDYIIVDSGLTNIAYNTLVTVTFNPPEAMAIKDFYVNETKTTLTNGKYQFRIKDDVSLSATITGASTVQIFYLNDLHGSIVENGEEMGLAKIANFINQMRLENPNSIFIAGGDMLQGSALSNYYMGTSTLDLLEMMGLDVFVVGNHEFDWGIEEVTKHFIGHNPKYSFPLLAANIFYKGTDDLLEGAQPYHIVERGGIKFGIIGYIGAGLESSISAGRVKDYEFRNPDSIIAEYASYLREVESVDFVIAVGHTGDGNDVIRSATGSSRVDLIFNAHTHRSYIDINGNYAPIIQSRSNGREVGYLEVSNISGVISINKDSMKNYRYYNSPSFQTPDLTIKAKIEAYQEETDPIFKTTIIANNEYINRDDFAAWLSKLMAIKTGSDVGIYNSGGVREDLSAGNITLEKLYKMLPFDNMVKSTILRGTSVNSEIDRRISYINGVTINPSNYYRVVTNDYVFDPDTSVYMRYGTETIIYEGNIRDWVVDELRLQAAAGFTFNLNNPIMSTVDPILSRGDRYQTRTFI